MVASVFFCPALLNCHCTVFVTIQFCFTDSKSRGFCGFCWSSYRCYRNGEFSTANYTFWIFFSVAEHMIVCKLDVF